jgi:hypothetical protein
MRLHCEYKVPTRVWRLSGTVTVWVVKTDHATDAVLPGSLWLRSQVSAQLGRVVSGTWLEHFHGDWKAFPVMAERRPGHPRQLSATSDGRDRARP